MEGTLPAIGHGSGPGGKNLRFQYVSYIIYIKNNSKDDF